MDVVKMKIKDIVPYKNNPRKNDNAVQAVKESIIQCGYCSPIIIDEDNIVLCGHTRLKALKQLGYKEVECVKKTGMTEQQKQKYRILDNKTNELATWDIDLLKEELKFLDFGDFDFGFDFFESEEKQTYESMKRDFEEKMAAGELSDDDEEYQEFLEKFQPKKTTDDCYTPPNVYEAVVKYVEDTYHESRVNFIRPFYPGGPSFNFIWH